MALGTVRRGSRTSSPNVAAASKPTKLSAAKIAPDMRPWKPFGDAVGVSGAAVSPSGPPPCPTMISASTR